MTDDFELVRGSGNVYRDFGRPNAGLEQARALVAAAIIGNLDARNLSTRDAEKLTGVSHSEFSRIRNAQLRRFTLDRMIANSRQAGCGRRGGSLHQDAGCRASRAARGLRIWSSRKSRAARRACRGSGMRGRQPPSSRAQRSDPEATSRALRSSGLLRPPLAALGVLAMTAEAAQGLGRGLCATELAGRPQCAPHTFGTAMPRLTASRPPTAASQRFTDRAASMIGPSAGLR